MTPARSPAYLVVGIGFVLAAGLSGSIGCARVGSSDHINPEDAGVSTGGSNGTAGSSGGLGGTGVTGSGGRSSGSGGFSQMDGGADAPGDGSVGCRLSIAPIAPPSYTGIEAGPGAHMRVQGAVSGAFTSPITWQWTVNSESSSAPIVTTPIDTTGALVEFPIEVVGRYQIVAQLAGQPACHASQVIDTVAPGPMTYVLRATATGFPIQDQRITLSPTDPQQVSSWQLQAGVAANLSPQRADLSGGSLASYIRISDPVSTLSIDGDSTKGPVMAPLLPSLSYDVLIVPSEPYAPDLIHGTPGQWPQPLQLDQGVMVTATTRDGGGKAVVGAHLVLRRQSLPMSLPSTVGVSDANGAATLWARAGTLTAFIEPPAGSGLPSAAVGAGSNPGIVLNPGVGSLDLAMTWDPVTSTDLSIHVLAPGGAPVGAGARVRATSQAQPARVGQLLVHPAGGSPVTLPAIGNTDVEVLTDANSTAAFAALPLGAYVVTVVPAATSAAPTARTPAITTTTLTLTSAVRSSDVMLSGKSTLNGTLLPISDSPGTQVTAIDRSATAPGTAVSATVGTDGKYQLFIDPGRNYELLAQPPAGVLRGRVILASSVSEVTPTLPTVTLPIVHPASGTILGANGAGAGGVLMQVFCPSTSTKCLDATFPLAETLTRADGSFLLLLPDPGN